MENENYNYFDEGEANINLDEFQDLNDFISRRRQPKDLGFFPKNVAQKPAMVKYGISSLPEFDPRNFQSIFPTSGIRQQVPLQNLGIDTSYGVANEEDVEQEFLPDREPSGIAKLFEFLGNIPTPFNLIRRGLGSLKGLNDRIQGSDFGRATSLMDYLDMRKYGGLQGRNDAAARNMAQAKGITKSLASKPSSTSGGYQQGPGGSGAQTTSAKSKTSSPTNVGNPFGYK